MRSVSVVLLVTLSTAAFGQVAPPPPPPLPQDPVRDVEAARVERPWEWTTAQRAAALRDPLKRLDRLRNDQGGPSSDVLDARRNPELFFPTELFEQLVRLGFMMMPGNYSKSVAQRSSDLFRDPAEWERFGVLVVDFEGQLLDRRRPRSEHPAEGRAGRALRRVSGSTMRR